MDYTPQNLEYAVSVFYNGEQTERAKAHTWLTAAQRAPQAWNFVWELLQPNKATEIQFYAATTLHTKILRCWNEVPAESYNELRDKLLQAVFLYGKGPKIVTNRLCISLAAFILQQGAVDLVSILRPLSDIENSSLLLEVLTVIPEEYNSMTMGTVLRAKNRASLNQACPAVLQDMLRYLQSAYNDYSSSPPTEETVQCWVIAATCVRSWLTLGGDDAPDHCVSLADRMPLVTALHAIPRVLYTWNEAISDSALDACEASLSAIRAAATTGDAGKYPASALQLFNCMAELGAPIMARDNVPNSINEELVSSIITCLVAIVETHAHTLVENDSEPGVRQIIELLISGQAASGNYPLHETRSSMLLGGVWCTLQDELQTTMRKRKTVNLDLWRDVFSRLLTALVLKSEAPADSAMSKEDMELLRCYRQDISDNVMYCYCVLGASCWTTIEEAYVAAESDIRREAVLHIFLALADIANDLMDVPFKIVPLLQHTITAVTNSSHTRLVSTALECLGAYAECIKYLESSGACPRSVCEAGVQAAGAALRALPAPAARALRRLVVCAPPPAPLVHHALHPPAGASSWVRQQLLAAAGAAIALCPRQEDAAPLLADVAAALLAMLRHQNAEPRNSTGACECAAAFLTGLNTRPQLQLAVFRTLLPELPGLATHPPLLEPLFQLLQPAVSSMIEDETWPTAELSELTVTAFNTQPCAKGLDFVKILLFAINDQETGTIVCRCAVTTTARVVATDPSGHSDLTEALFTFLATLTKKLQHYISGIKDSLPELVELACWCVRAWEAGAARAACAWLAALAGARPLDLQPHARALTAAALACIGGGTPRSQVEPLAGLLLALGGARWAAPRLADLLRDALAPDGFPTPHATPAHKDHFIRAVIREKKCKRRLLEAVHEFSLACRGLVGTEYARQTIASKQLVS